MSSLGPEVTDLIAPLLPDFKKQVGGLGSTLDSVPATKTVYLALISFLQRLGTAEAVAAGWRDVVATFRNLDASAECCEMRILQLVELAEHRGVDYENWAQKAERILGDDARILASLGETVGGVSDAQKDTARVQLAGVNEERRIQLCEGALSELPDKSAIAVWLALTEASLMYPCLAVGRITLFDAEWWPDRILEGSAFTEAGEKIPAPQELNEEVFRQALTDALGDWPTKTGCTLVRVWFEESTPTLARNAARMVVRGLIDLAGPNTSWRLLDGEMTWTPQHWSGRGYADPDEEARARKRKPPRLDRTQAGIQQFDSAFIGRWLDGSEEAQRGADDALWVATLRHTQSYEQRTILAVRAVEYALGHVKAGASGNWVDAAGRYLRSVLVNHVLLNELQDALFAALSAIERCPKRPDGLRERLARMASPPDNAHYTWSMLTREMAEVLPQVPQILADGSMEQRIIRGAADFLQSPEAALKKLADIEAWFERMLARTSRQRNALVHSTGTVRTVLQNIDDFALLLATYASDEPLRRAQDGRKPLADFELDRVQFLERQSRLKAGAPPSEVLWMPPEA